MQYLAELCKLSETYLKQALRDQLVCGLVSERIQQRLLSEVDLSLENAFKIAQSMETAHRETLESRKSDWRQNQGKPALFVGKGVTTLITASLKIKNVERVGKRVWSQS